MTQKVILLGVDGATWSLLNPLLQSGVLPAFSKLVTKGTWATLNSTIPTTSLPAWTSIFTGVNPGKHGLTDFKIRVNDEIVMATTALREQESIWQYLSHLGLKSIVINNPSVFPPEQINGIMTSGLMTPSYSRQFVYPKSVEEEIEEVAPGYESDLPQVFFEIIKRDKNQAYKLIMDYAEKICRVGIHFAETRDWDVFALIITSTDRVQHFYWDQKEIIRDHYIWVDQILKQLFVLSKEQNATLILVSDHGFMGTEKVFYINNWLYKQKLLHIKRNLIRIILSRLGLTFTRAVRILKLFRLHSFIGKIVPSKITQILPGNPLRPPTNLDIDLERTKAHSPFQHGIYVSGNIPQQERQIILDLLFKKLKELRDPNTQKLIFEMVHLSKELLWGPFVERAPDILLKPYEGFGVRPYIIADSSEITLRPPIIGRTGQHDTKGVFAIHGQYIREKHRIRRDVQTWDIVPIILHILNQPIPNDLDGKVILELFQTNSPLSNPPTEFVDRKIVRRRKGGYTEEEQKIIEERLRSLGYL